MSEGQILLLVLAAAMVVEGLAWVPKGAVAFLAPLGARRRPHHPEGVLAGKDGALLVSTPLPPLSPPLLCREPPVERVPWDAIRSVEAIERRVLVNGALLLRASGPAEALRLARSIGEAAEGGPPALHAWLARTLDATEARRRLADLAARSREPRIAANLLFGYLFVAIPAATLVFPPERLWLPALAGLAALLVWLLPAWFSAHRALHPDARADRILHLLAMTLFPPAAVRCADSLAKPLLLDLHPLAAAAELCRREAFRALARRYLRETAFPRPGPREPGAERARVALLEAIGALVRRRDEDPDALLAPSPPSSPAVRSACPRCGAEYEVPTGECSDCGLPLVPLKAPPGP